MAIKKIAPTYECTEPKQEYIIDTDEEIEDVPACGAGSTAICPASGKLYMKNASGRWVLFGGGE